MMVRPVSGALEVNRRRALRGYRGRTETPPAKLSACATCRARGNIRTRITLGHLRRPRHVVRALAVPRYVRTDRAPLR